MIFRFCPNCGWVNSELKPKCDQCGNELTTDLVEENAATDSSVNWTSSVTYEDEYEETSAKPVYDDEDEYDDVTAEERSDDIADDADEEEQVNQDDTATVAADVAIPAEPVVKKAAPVPPAAPVTAAAVASGITFDTIVEVAERLRANCRDMDRAEADLKAALDKEQKNIDAQSKKQKEKMQQKYDAFVSQFFKPINAYITDLTAQLQKDYPKAWDKCDVDYRPYQTSTYEKNMAQLYPLLDVLRDKISLLNAVSFDQLVPPRHIVQKKEYFFEYSGEVKLGKYDSSTPKRTQLEDPKPIERIVMEVITAAKSVYFCLFYIEKAYEKSFNIQGFNSIVDRCAKDWMARVRDEADKYEESRLNALFEDVEQVQASMLQRIEKDRKSTHISADRPSNRYNRFVNMGDVELQLAQDAEHIAYINDSKLLKRSLTFYNGWWMTPLMMDLTQCGNIMLNVKEENYSDETRALVNQIIMQYLLSFPAGRIKFCLVDVDNKVNFSKFSTLNKISSDILLKGIVRDDRKLDDTIKDLEQIMYKVDEDILSYNNVPNIFEYNAKYESNPQTIYLFVLVNFPSGVREDTAKRVQKIVSGGNKSGIFTLLVNNSAATIPTYSKPDVYNGLIEAMQASSLVMDVKNGTIRLRCDIPNRYRLDSRLTTEQLPAIVANLVDLAKGNKQIDIPLADMFDRIDEQVYQQQQEKSSDILDIPLGMRGGEVQNLLLMTASAGSPHTVVIGGTGSGKSNLLHTIIMDACYKYSPEELNLYLVDMKGGVGFKFYEANKVRENQIPHIKLTGLTSDINDGLAILENLLKQLREREDEFRRSNVEDIIGYCDLGKKMPRLFVIIDEFQSLFEQEAGVSDRAIQVLGELFKKGRAFGINLLLASQNIPRVTGLQDKVLSQIGNRISLSLNNPDDALDIKIDPKAVQRLQGREKGLGLIRDPRYNEDAVEFRVAYANNEDRAAAAQAIISKWADLNSRLPYQPLYIVGNDEDARPGNGNTRYARPFDHNRTSMAFGEYAVQVGENYITGKPYDINIALREDKSNILFAGRAFDEMRDAMGYSLLSVLMANCANSDCQDGQKYVYFANGEKFTVNTERSLLKKVRDTFEDRLNLVTSTDAMIRCVKELYTLYKQRIADADAQESAVAYPPVFFVGHAMQNFYNLFNTNPKLPTDEEVKPADSGASDDFAQAQFLFGQAAMSTAPARRAPGEINNFVPVFNELISRGGKVGIHFILSADNPAGLPGCSDLRTIYYKVFLRGVHPDVVAQYQSNAASRVKLDRNKIGLVCHGNEYDKVSLYLYDEEKDADWFRALCDSYRG